MALTKVQIVENVQKKLNNYSKSESTRVVETLLEIIKSTLANGDDVLISGFGKFCVNKKKERKGRNPATDEEMILAERKVVTFKCSSKLREKVNY